MNKPQIGRPPKNPSDKIKNYKSKLLYFRTGELQKIEKKLGRKSNSRDYIIALCDKLKITVDN